MSQYRQNPSKPNSATPPQAEAAEGSKDDRIAINGFNQVLEMLKIADPKFRESLLQRLAQRDRELARTLRADLADLGL